MMCGCYLEGVMRLCRIGVGRLSGGFRDIVLKV